MEICLRPETKTIVGYIARHMRDGLKSIMESYPDFFIGIRQRGVVMGLEFDHAEGAMHVMEALYQNGVWAIFSTLDPRVLQFKPGILLDRNDSDEVLNRMDSAVASARHNVLSGKATSRQFTSDAA